MGKRTKHAPGTFSWVDLSTTDPDGARPFYTALFGWEAEDVPSGDAGVYTMFRIEGDAVAALYSQPEQQRAAGVPPYWQSYVTVASADDAAERAGDLGGSVILEPFDVMENGRMTAIQDPAGAWLALWEPRSDIGAERVNDPGCLSWNDLITPDPDATEKFYAELFGWEIQAVEGGAGYRTIRNQGRANGGMMPASLMGGDVPPHWLPYFNSGVLDRAVGEVGELGGRVIAGPQEVPAGRFAAVQDPQGATFALFEGEVDD